MRDAPRLIWQKSALMDLYQIARYVAQHNRAASENLQLAIETKVKLLPYNPKAYRKGRAPRTREMVAHPNYIIVYRETRTDITILRVLHAAQSWP